MTEPAAPRVTMSAATRCVSSSTPQDRKSTRLNSSHDQISYAVFCLKKKSNDDGETSERFDQTHPPLPIDRGPHRRRLNHDTRNHQRYRLACASLHHVDVRRCARPLR